MAVIRIFQNSHVGVMHRFVAAERKASVAVAIHRLAAVAVWKSLVVESKSGLAVELKAVRVVSRVAVKHQHAVLNFAMVAATPVILPAGAHCLTVCVGGGLSSLRAHKDSKGH